MPRSRSSTRSGIATAEDLRRRTVIMPICITRYIPIDILTQFARKRNASAKMARTANVLCRQPGLHNTAWCYADRLLKAICRTLHTAAAAVEGVGVVIVVSAARSQRVEGGQLERLLERRVLRPGCGQVVPVPLT